MLQKGVPVFLYGAADEQARTLDSTSRIARQQLMDSRMQLRIPKLQGLSVHELTVSPLVGELVLSENIIFLKQNIIYFDLASNFKILLCEGGKHLEYFSGDSLLIYVY
ncbi:uncharacterized protein LOC131232358 [Magnolia sinica]|uniref:uncharacterized protein LOC131232358 n=1 Tax=Magnolia sinica TaxID=86752 RepID=UPI002659B2A8|nr:uncharacterized protein LOC131232358 [Magnolia sinica]